MNIVTLLPFVVLIGAMFLMTRSAKKKQRQASQMRQQMQPGTGIRTIGGMYALVKEVREDSVLLEVAPGLHALYAKNSIGAVLDAEEYDRIINGEPLDLDVDDAPVVPDDASELLEDEEEDDREGKIDLGKSDAADEDADADLDDDADEAEDAGDEDAADETGAAAEEDADAEADGDVESAKNAKSTKNSKRDGNTGSK